VITCTTTTTTTVPGTPIVTKIAGEPIVMPLDNTFANTPTTGPCEVGNSGRVGTAEGISTQESTNVSTQPTEITVTQPTETTTISVKTETFQGNKKGDPLTSETVTSSVTIPKGAPSSSDPVAVGDAELISTPIGNPVFTATGRCQNVPGPQNQQAVGNANERALEPRPRGNQPVMDTLAVEELLGDITSQ